MDKSKPYKLIQATIENFICVCNRDLIISVNSLDEDTVTITKKFEHNNISLKIGYEKTLILTDSICDAARCIMAYITRYNVLYINTLYIDVDGQRVTINFKE